uniref:Uncharacterized protein n=1 Tax=Knipowitschia caucasica TaxID=637954 RepID=A0AAV2L4N0_KNICA
MRRIQHWLLVSIQATFFSCPLSTFSSFAPIDPLRSLTQTPVHPPQPQSALGDLPHGHSKQQPPPSAVSSAANIVSAPVVVDAKPGK